MRKFAVLLGLGLASFLLAEPSVFSSCPKVYSHLRRGELLNGGFAVGISVEEMQGIANSLSTPGLAIGPLPGKSFEQVLINASYRKSFWEKIGVVIRDIAGSHLLNDGNHRVAYLIAQRLIERNGIVRNPSNSDDQIYDIISKVGRKADGYRTPEEIAQKLRGY
ncbi:MAG: hypothetical protein EBQ92_12955 [Proteobacteria bacterium]|nr:hypothetical protein [Pseudomonadota bacterium]